MLALAQTALGLAPTGTRVPVLAELRPTPSALPVAVAEQFVELLGAAGVRTDAESRIRHLRGKSTPDLLRIRAGDLEGAPDAVLLPARHQQILELLQICAEHRIAVVPFGGGTSVVGGLEPDAEVFAAVVAIDLQNLTELLELDEVSRTVTLEPGLRGPEAEALVNARGYTIGHFPQSFEYATIGGFAAARSSGQASAGYGRFDERVVGLRVATPRGTIEVGNAPRSAAGPDLRQLFLGSEGAFGIITAVTVELDRLPEARAYEGWRFPSFSEGAAALRALAQDGPRPTVLRLSDEVESAINLANPDAIGADGQTGGCLAIVGCEGTAAAVEERVSTLAAILTQLGGVRDADAGASWAHGRYAAPYLRDAMIDAGATVETLETACFWSRLPDLYDAVRTALTETLTELGTPPLVLCHISHIYRSGASLYFTVACAQADDPVAQWRRAKGAASDAIVSTGAAITHHHGVGRDHRDWYVRQTGELGIAALQAVKRELDPSGILNPGVLLP